MSTPRIKSKSSSIPTLKTSQVRSPPQKWSQFRRHHWNQVNSIPTLKSSQFRCLQIKTKVISIQTLKPSIFRPPHKIEVNSDLHTEIKPSSPTLRSSQFRPPTQKPCGIRSPAQKIKLISTHHWFFKSVLMPRDKKQVNFHTDTKTKSFSTPRQKLTSRLKSSQVRSTTLKARQFRPPTKKTTGSAIRFPTQKSSKFRPTTEIKSISIPTLTSNQIWCLDTKPKLISIKTLKTSHFRTSHKNQVKSDLYTKIKSSSILHIEIKSISTTHTKAKSNSMLTLKPSDFRPAYKNQVNFDHHTKTKPIDLHIKTSHVQSAQKKTQSRSSYWN